MPIFSSFIFFASGILSGLICLRLLDPEKRLSFGERLVSAASVGLTVLVSIVLGLASAFGNLTTGIFGGAFLALGLSAVFARTLAGEIRAPALNSASIAGIGKWTVIGLALFGAIYVGVLYTVFTKGADGTPQGILKGWGDVAYHLDIIEVLATANPFRLSQPIAAGQPLTYPFLIDLFSSILRKFGLGIFASWHVPVMLFGLLLFAAVFFFGKRLLEREALAMALVIIVFFGGGLGFLWFFRDVANIWQTAGTVSSDVLGRLDALLKNLGSGFPHEYTHLDSRTGGKPQFMEYPANIVWIVPAISFFSHQRSFILGALISIVMFLGMLAYWREPEVIWRWIALGGLLPLAHTHSFFTVSVLILPAFFVMNVISNGMRAVKWWILGGTIAVVIALPSVILLASGGILGEGRGNAFLRPWLGWMMCEHGTNAFKCSGDVPGTDSNIIWFWLKNFGVIFLGWVAVLIAWVGLRRVWRGPARYLVFPSILVLLVSHLVLLQPWEFDNNKAIFYWWLFAATAALSLIGCLWNSPVGRRFAVAALAVFVVTGSFAGFLDIANRFMRFDNYRFGYYGEAEIAAAAWIRANTGPSDAFLTGDGANAFVPMLTGRPIYLGFTGWLWTQGRNDVLQERKRAVGEMLTLGKIDALCDAGVRYVMWDQGFLATYPYAGRERIAPVTYTVFAQGTPVGEREILRLKCQ